MKETVFQVPALQDNYIHLVHNEELNLTYAIDPSEAGPVIKACEQSNWKIAGVLLTHHHGDHTDGAQELRDTYGCPIYGHEKDLYRIPQITHPLKTVDREKHELKLAGFTVEYFATPGHTLGHICLYFKEVKSLFCGDTLFSYGCGRLFEGTAEQMLTSLKAITSYPDDTKLFCGHEYTQKNLEFALSLEPNNENLKHRYNEIKKLRHDGFSTLPALVGDQKKISPFLRGNDAALKTAMNLNTKDELQVFTAIRTKRNSF